MLVQLVGGPFHGVRMHEGGRHDLLVMACPLVCKEGSVYEWDGYVYLYRENMKPDAQATEFIAWGEEFEEMVTKKQLENARFKRDVRVEWLKSQREKECDEHKKDWDKAINKQSMLFPEDFEDGTDVPPKKDG